MTKSNLLLLILETMNDDNWPQYRYALFAIIIIITIIIMNLIESVYKFLLPLPEI